MLPSVSIIVPMYNTSAYLKECVESIRAQTLSNIEIILIDDGSLDECGSIAEDYKTIDSRIKVIHRENGGLGAARNTGIDNSTGQYIGFVDSDDWVDKEMFGSLYSAAVSNNADVVLTGLKRVAFGNVIERYRNPHAGIVFHDDNVFEIRKEFYGSAPNQTRALVTPSVCCSVFRKDMLDRYGTRFTTQKSEDSLFNLEAYQHVTCAACVDGSPYNYRNDLQPSITNSFDDTMLDLFEQRFRAQEALIQYERTENRSECVYRTKKWGIDVARTLITRVANFAGAEKRIELVKMICQQQFVLDSIEGFPHACLPVRQRVFYHAIKNRNVRVLLFLVKMRKAMRH